MVGLGVPGSLNILVGIPNPSKHSYLVPRVHQTPSPTTSKLSKVTTKNSPEASEETLRFETLIKSEASENRPRFCGWAIRVWQPENPRLQWRSEVGASHDFNLAILKVKLTINRDAYNTWWLPFPKRFGTFCSPGQKTQMPNPGKAVAVNFHPLETPKTSNPVA